MPREQQVAKGSYLIIEQFGHMSRANADVTLSLLLDFMHGGIKVATVVGNKIGDKKTSLIRYQLRNRCS